MKLIAKTHMKNFNIHEGEWKEIVDNEIQHCKKCGSKLVVIRHWRDRGYDPITGEVVWQERVLVCPRRVFLRYGHVRVIQRRNPIERTSGFMYDEPDW